LAWTWATDSSSPANERNGDISTAIRNDVFGLPSKSDQIAS